MEVVVVGGPDEDCVGDCGDGGMQGGEEEGVELAVGAH